MSAQDNISVDKQVEKIISSEIIDVQGVAGGQNSAPENFNPLSRSSKFAHLHHINPKQNHLLAALPQEEFDSIVNELKLVQLTLGDSIYTPGLAISYAYFPISCVVSLHYVTESGASAQTASVGNEGVVGVSIIMGGDSMASSATTVISGFAYKLEANALKHAFKHKPFLHQILLIYLQMLYTQTAQNAVCNRYHTIEQQFARWLLVTSDQITTKELVVTQELLAGLLGVRRESITQAAGNLQNGQLINYRRGHISVLDREALKSTTCECYEVLQRELLRLLANVKK